MEHTTDTARIAELEGAYIKVELERDKYKWDWFNANSKNVALTGKLDEATNGLKEIAAYQSVDFGLRKEQWKWCNEFIDIAVKTLKRIGGEG